MSDSDDTDVLLLIPPDFFSIDSSREEKHIAISPKLHLSQKSFNSYSEKLFTNMERPLGDYSFLPPKQQSELKSIDAKLIQMEKNLSTSSELSTISNCTVRSKHGQGFRARDDYKKTKVAFLSPNKLIHSTPKNLNFDTENGRHYNEESGVIKEIDQFFEEKRNCNFWSGNGEANRMSTDKSHISRACDSEQPVTFINPELNSMNLDKCSRLSVWPVNNLKDNNLLSLNELWNEEKRNGSLTMQEERLRRQHLEKTIHSLQSKLLEYQQKISVAMQVDRTKDDALAKVQEENGYLKRELQKYEELVSGLETFQTDLKTKNENLEKDLAQAINLVSKFQDKNEILEIKVDNLSKATNEVNCVYKKQIEDLEDRWAHSHRAEELSRSELSKFKDLLAKSQYEEEKATQKCEKVEAEITLLKKQKQTLSEKFNSQKNIADKLEKDNQDLQETCKSLAIKENNLSKELENQKQSLKSYYQQQLEKVVSTKLQEFQTELDRVEESLKNEAKDRERLIAERAMKQIELINEKNEQEINLIQEKQNNEIELYRIQLSNASKKINDLETKLTFYKSKRVDIAEKLHNVMETQWQKALEILTSPNQDKPDQNKPINAKHMDKEKLDGTAKNKVENEYFETPSSSRERKSVESERNERLHAFIEMLLSKSPRDLQNLEAVIAQSKHQSTAPKSNEKPREKYSNLPPWK